MEDQRASEMVNPLLESREHIELRKSAQNIARDSMIVQTIKRLFSIAPLIVMSFTTINQIFSVVKSMTSQSSNDQKYNAFVEVTSNGQSSYFECEYGNAQAVVTYCPYQPFKAFQGIVAVWVIYFAVFMVVRLWATRTYHTNDLRFYIAIDRYNGQFLNIILVAIGYLLTAISTVVALVYMSPQSDWNSVIDTTSVLTLVIFIGINVVSLYGLLRMTTGSTHHKSNITMNDFPHEILFTSGRGVLEVFASVEGVIKPILVSYVLYLVDGDVSLLQEYGNAERLREAMNKLYKPPVR